MLQWHINPLNVRIAEGNCMHEAQMAGIRLKLIYAIAALRSAEPCSVKPVYLGLQELRIGRHVSTPARPPCHLWRGGAPAASAISERLFHRHAYIYVCTLRLPTRTAVEFTFFAAFGVFVRLTAKLLAAAKKLASQTLRNGWETQMWSPFRWSQSIQLISSSVSNRPDGRWAALAAFSDWRNEVKC